MNNSICWFLSLFFVDLVTNLIFYYVTYAEFLPLLGERGKGVMYRLYITEGKGMRIV